jgi:hypothetical protein
MPRPDTIAKAARKRGAKNAEPKKQEKKTAQRLNSGPTHSRDLILPKSADLDVFPGMRLRCLARA